MIINLRGTNGSGKSAVARALMAPGAEMVDLAPYANAAGAARHVVGYHVPALDLIVVGPYHTECGGCDLVKTQDLVCESVRLAAGMSRHTFFEGVIVSTLFSRYLALSRGLPRGITWAYLDTPPDVCLSRITARNGGRPIKERFVIDKHRSIARTAERARAAGEDVRTVPHGRAAETVAEWLA